MRNRNLFASLFVTTLAVGSVTTPAKALDVEDVSFGNLISALNNLDVAIDDLELLTDLIDIGDVNIEDVNITVVDVDDVLSGNRVRALNNALNRNDVDIDALQDFLNDNDILNDALNDLDIDIDDVVGIDVLSGGDLLVFVD